MSQAQSSSFKINSQFFTQQLDSLIIQLTRVMAVEHSIRPDPDAKEMVRKMLLNRAHQLMSEQSETFVKEHVKLVRTNIKNGSEILNRNEYELIKLVGLDEL